MEVMGHVHPSPIADLDVEDLAVVLEHVWMLLCSVLLMILQIGFAVIETGCVQERNVISTLMKHLLVLMVGAVAWLLLGSAIAFHRPALEVNVGDGEQATTLLGLLLCLTTVTIALRGVAERSRIGAHVAMAVIVPIVLYPLVLRWTQPGGWLLELDPPFHSGASRGEPHLVGGVAAAVGARLAGPRRERSKEQDHESQHLSERRPRRRSRSRAQDKPQYRAPPVVLGTLVIWVGWYGFAAANPGGMRTREQALLAARMAVNMTLGAVSGGLVALFLRMAALKLHLRRQIRIVSVGEVMRDPPARSTPSSLDFVVCCFGAIAGLVAVSSGSDCLENGTGLLVGALGSLAGYLGAKACKAFHIDDPMEAGSVHGIAGAVGVLCVGIFDRHEGLLFSGEWGLLWSQFLGVLTIGTFTAATSFVIFAALRCLGVLGFPKHRHRQELTLEAIQELVSILDRSSLSIADTLEALSKLKRVVHRPFSPQAGNHKIQGEVLDVCNLMNFSVRPDDEYIAFVSHYKAEGGDAARIIYDHITQAVLKRVGISRSGSHCSPTNVEHEATTKSRKKRSLNAEGFFGVLPRVQLTLSGRGSGIAKGHSDGHQLAGEGRNSGISLARGRSDGHLETSRRSMVVDNGRSAGADSETPEVGGMLSRLGAAKSRDRSPERRIPSEPVSDPETESSCMLHLRNLITNASSSVGVHSKFDSERLLFLDSCELRDLDELLSAVRRSSNFILLLTQGVLTRPWVLAELSVAVAEKKNIVAVRIEWPHKDDEKHFEFPDCIEGVVQQLESCAAVQQLQHRKMWVTESVAGGFRDVSGGIRDLSRRMSIAKPSSRKDRSSWASTPNSPHSPRSSVRNSPNTSGIDLGSASPTTCADTTPGGARLRGDSKLSLEGLPKKDSSLNMQDHGIALA